MPDRTISRRLLAPLAALVLALSLGATLAACGDDDDKSSTTETSATQADNPDQAEIRALFLAAAADPAGKLCDSATDEFKQVITGKNGEVANRECATRAKGLPPFKGVKITTIKVSGDTATATVSAQGQPPDEQKFQKVDGKWKITSDAAPAEQPAAPPSSGGGGGN